MDLHEAKDYGPFFNGIINTKRAVSLGPGDAERETFTSISQSSLEKVFAPGVVKSKEYADLCIAGLWLLTNHLDESHRISQRIANATGSYWHGIMHRREGDYWNSKYWFRQVGDHPVFHHIRRAIKEILSTEEGERVMQPETGSGTWDPFIFVDRCSAVYRSGNEEEKWCELVQQLEWQLLFDYSFNSAIRSPK